MDLKSLKDIPANFALARRALLFCLIMSITISIGSLIWAYITTNNIKNSAFVLTKDGQAALLQTIPIGAIDDYRKPEIINHVKMFHKAFWEIDQFNYKRKIDKALYLSGRSGKQLFKTLEANGHFAKISTQNLTQKIEIDSIKVNDQVTPYQAKFYGKLKVLRTDQKSESINDIRAKFVLYNVARTNKNPHGLLIENYHLESKPVVIK
ncbi:VirB8/TrbF family protein [Aquimarina sp. W85]|uniref:VirB8/TrbF family protein n=1 Tax=Aquimarina rhodophyticola TaxID=3342246 RepID=UPI00366BAF32